MKTLKYISNTFRFLKGANANAKTNTNTSNEDNFELTNNKFGINLKRAPTSGKAKSSLLTLMYSEENETLFI